MLVTLAHTHTHTPFAHLHLTIKASADRKVTSKLNHTILTSLACHVVVSSCNKSGGI